MSDKLKPCREECSRFGAHTGNAGVGEDSLFMNGIGPLCEYCYDYHRLRSEIEQVRDEILNSPAPTGEPARGC